VKRSCRDEGRLIRESADFPCLTRETGKGRALEIDPRTAEQVAVLPVAQSRLIRESARCGFHFPVHRVTMPPEISQNTVYRVLARGRVLILHLYVENPIHRNQYL